MRRYLLLVLLLVLPLFWSLGSPVAGEEAPAKVKVGVWINSIEKVDVPSQTFTVDFYVWFKYGGEKPDIEFMKGTPTTMTLIQQEERGGENYLEYRVKGVYVSSLNFRNFPFDEHLLTVELEDKHRGVSKLVFEPDEEESGLDPNLTVPGWEVKDFRLYVDQHVYPDENYSKFIFGVTVYRSKTSAFFKYFFPILIITLISLLTFSISVKNFGQRVGICVTTLMSAVAYHLAALSGLPSLGYLTLFDRIMLVVYTLFLYNLVVSVQAMRLVEAGRVKEAEGFETRMQNLLPFLALGLFLVYVLVLGLL